MGRGFFPSPASARPYACSYLLENEQLQHGSSFSRWEYKEGLGPALWLPIERLGRSFPEVGAFFTDEAQDGVPFEGLMGHSDQRWRFDLVWVSREQVAEFTLVPDSYYEKELAGGRALASMSAWPAPPWAYHPPPA